MSLYKRSKTGPYWYEFAIKGLRFRGSTEETDREAAKAAEARARIAARLGTGGRERAQLTLNQGSERYFQEVAKHQASASTTDYQLANLVRLIGKNTLLSEIDDNRIAGFVSSRRGERSGRAPGDHKKSCRCERCALSPATVNREVELLRRVLRRADRIWKVEVADMPAWVDHLLQEPAERVRELTAVEEEALFPALRPDFHALVRFCLACGVRQQDAVTLTWRQVDFDAELIRFKTKSRKPGGQPHVVPMTAEIRAILQGEKGRNAVRVFTYVCRRSRGKRQKGERYPFSRSGWTRDWRAALAEAGIEDFRFHDSRHTIATRVLRKTGNLKAVQKLLGHATIASTARYAHVDIEDLRAAMEAATPTKSPTPIEDAKKKA